MIAGRGRGRGGRGLATGLRGASARGSTRGLATSLRGASARGSIRGINFKTGAPLKTRGVAEASSVKSRLAVQARITHPTTQVTTVDAHTLIVYYYITIAWLLLSTLCNVDSCQLLLEPTVFYA